VLELAVLFADPPPPPHPSKDRVRKRLAIEIAQRL